MSASATDLVPSVDRTADKIAEALRNHRAPVSVAGGRVLPSFVEILLRPEPGTRYSAVRNLQADIQLAVGREVRIAQSGIHIAVQIARQAVVPIHLGQLMTHRAVAGAPSYTAVLGLDAKMEPVLACLSSPVSCQWLIAGTTGSGKTKLAQTAILSLTSRHKPRELLLLVVDPKRRGMDSFTWQIQSHLARPVARSVDDAVAALQSAATAMGRRAIVPFPTPRVLIYIDEVADLCAQDARVNDLLTHIAQTGREYGFHLICCTQKPTTEAIGSLLKANLPYRLVGRVANAHEARTAAGLSDTGAENLSNAGMFIACGAGRPVLFQAALPPEVTVPRSIMDDQPQATAQPDTPSVAPEENLAEQIAALLIETPSLTRTDASQRLFGVRGGRDWQRISQAWPRAMAIARQKISTGLPSTSA